MGNRLGNTAGRGGLRRFVVGAVLGVFVLCGGTTLVLTNHTHRYDYGELWDSLAAVSRALEGTGMPITSFGTNADNTAMEIGGPDLVQNISARRVIASVAAAAAPGVRIEFVNREPAFDANL